MNSNSKRHYNNIKIHRKKRYKYQNNSDHGASVKLDHKQEITLNSTDMVSLCGPFKIPQETNIVFSPSRHSPNADLSLLYGDVHHTSTNKIVLDSQGSTFMKKRHFLTLLDSFEIISAYNNIVDQDQHNTIVSDEESSICQSIESGFQSDSCDSDFNLSDSEIQRKVLASTCATIIQPAINKETENLAIDLLGNFSNVTIHKGAEGF